MILIIEMLSIWLGLALLFAAVAAPALVRRFRAHDAMLARHHAWARGWSNKGKR